VQILKRGKAADIHDITTEHLMFSHPINYRSCYQDYLYWFPQVGVFRLA